MSAVEGYYNQGTNGGIEDFLDTPGFDSYLKTVLWNRKNAIGIDNKKKYTIRGHVDSDSVKQQKPASSSDAVRNEDNFLDIPDTSASGFEILESDDFVNHLEDDLTDDEKEIADLLLNESKSTKIAGTANLAELSRLTGKRWL